ncbi:hypothetical protein R3P38DRAFT_3276425 [Favolaschia claudopus]|uniref:Uncharacterized protein n=1 Tax=Favolaschia claudopus TaxID=2862362 RepID=A0AAW0ASG1_9AGAR
MICIKAYQKSPVLVMDSRPLTYNYFNPSALYPSSQLPNQSSNFGSNLNFNPPFLPQPTDDFLRPPSPPKAPDSYSTFWSAQEKAAAPAETLSASSIDRILNQPPPSGHAMFSASPQKRTRISSLADFSAMTNRLKSFGQFQSSDNFSLRFATPSKEADDNAASSVDMSDVPFDNLDASPHQSIPPSGQPPKRTKPALTLEQKLDKLFDFLKNELDWTLGETLHHIFFHIDDNHRSRRHGIIVESYLAGKGLYTVSGILDAWLKSPDGRGHTHLPLFDTNTAYLDIRPVRQALTGFAAQICAEQLEQEARQVVKPAGGLRAVIEADEDGVLDDVHVEWNDLRSVIQDATRRIRETQPLAVHFLATIAEPKPRIRNGTMTIRKSRPRENVVINALASLDYCKNDQARLLPLARGILYLSSNVPVEIIAHGCRLGNMPAALAMRKRGRDITVTIHPDGRIMVQAKGINFDNVQHFNRQRDARMGRENIMFYEFTVELAALDLLDKRKRISTSRRPQITVDDLLGMIDQPHWKVIGALQFIEALTNYVPEAEVYKPLATGGNRPVTVCLWSKLSNRR